MSQDLTENCNLSVIRGITITPPLIGRITMGHTEVRGGGEEAKGIPKKDDHFTVTTLCQKSDRSWEIHPIQATLVKGKEKLLRIPVRIAYNDPGLTLQNSYSCFDTEKKTVGRVMCTGNGETARRTTDEGVKQIACPRPEACEYGVRFRCKNMTRAYFQIEGQEDDLGMFVLRSTGRNTLDALAGRLARLHGMSGGKLAGMPLMLELKAKTTAQSFRKPFYYADLVFRPGLGLIETIKTARAYQSTLAEADLHLDDMEAAIRAGLANGDFADEIEDIDEWVSDDALVAMAGGGQRQSGGLKGLDAVLDKLAAGAPSAPAVAVASEGVAVASSAVVSTLPIATLATGSKTPALPDPSYAMLSTETPGLPRIPAPASLPINSPVLALAVPPKASIEPLM
jgi:hypothetical protein